MGNNILQAKVRELTGKKPAKDIRKQGEIPCVFYSKDKNTVLQVVSKDFEKILHSKAGLNVLIELSFEENSKLNSTVIIKEIQRHPIRQSILHIDFEKISLKEKLVASVPVVLKGEAKGVNEGGMLEHHLWEVEVECLPTNIPTELTIDVSALNIGDSLYVKDLELSAEVVMKTELEEIVVSVAAQKEEVVEGEEGEEGSAEPEVLKQKTDQEEAGSEKKKEEKPEKTSEPEKK
jgi:large subunit ribosomal protein L25